MEYDPFLHSIPDDPPVRTWVWITEVDLDFRNSPEKCGLSAAEWAEVRAQDGVWVNGYPGKSAAPAGARVQVYAFTKTPPLIDVPGDLIVLDRDGVVAANKPSGLSTQRTRVSDRRNLQALLIDILGDPGLRAVHRLDRDTSGVVLFARDRASTAALHKQFRERTIHKTYQAVVTPAPAQEAWTVKGYIERMVAPSSKPGPLMFCLTDGPEGKHSETGFRRLAVNGDCALIEARPVTGRTHQLRVHLAHGGHPIMGDRMYGDPQNAQRLMLHAAALEFSIGDEALRLECPPPVGFKA